MLYQMQIRPESVRKIHDLDLSILPLMALGLQHLYLLLH